MMKEFLRWCNSCKKSDSK